MTESRQVQASDVGNAFFDALTGILKWLLQIVAIAIGTCLGIVLFLMVAREYAGEKLEQLDLQYGNPATSSR